MKKTLRILCVLLAMLAFLVSVLFISRSCDASQNRAYESGEISGTDENIFSGELHTPQTTKTNPDDDGFGSEVGM